MTLKDILDNFLSLKFVDVDRSDRVNPLDEIHRSDGDDDARDDIYPNNQPFSSFTFGMDPSSEDDLFGMMDRMMRGFGRNFDSFSDSTQAGGPFSSDRRQQKKSLREEILKEPEPELYSHHGDDAQSSLQQNDLDSMIEDFFGRSMFAPFLKHSIPQQDTDAVVERGGLESILKGDRDDSTADRREISPFSSPFSGFHGMSESRSMIRRSDGSTEERVTRQDASGHKETTIITQSPNGERRTEVRRSDGSVETTLDCGTSDLDVLRPNTPSSSMYPDSMFSNMNSFIKYIFS